MHSTVIVTLVGLSLLSTSVVAQTNPQTAAIESSASTNPTPSSTGGITREQYTHNAQERAGQRAGVRFDQMDTNHDGVLDRAEIRAWRSQHPRRAAARSSQPAPQ